MVAMTRLDAGRITCRTADPAEDAADDLVRPPVALDHRQARTDEVGSTAPAMVGAAYVRRGRSPTCAHLETESRREAERLRDDPLLQTHPCARRWVVVPGERDMTRRQAPRLMTERGPGQRADDAVDNECVLPLELLHRRAERRDEHYPVTRAKILNVGCPTGSSWNSGLTQPSSPARWE